MPQKLKLDPLQNKKSELISVKNQNTSLIHTGPNPPSNNEGYWYDPTMQKVIRWNSGINRRETVGLYSKKYSRLGPASGSGLLNPNNSGTGTNNRVIRSNIYDAVVVGISAQAATISGSLSLDIAVSSSLSSVSVDLSNTYYYDLSALNGIIPSSSRPQPLFSNAVSIEELHIEVFYRYLS